MKQARERPAVLRVKSQAAAIAEEHQHLLDIVARADSSEGIRQGLKEARMGEGRPAREFFVEFRAKHGIPVKVKRD